MAPNLNVTDNSDGSVNVSGHCVFTGVHYTVRNIPEAQWQKYLGGELVQRAFPTMSRDDREFLISGISPTGWKETFKEEPEE